MMIVINHASSACTATTAQLHMCRLKPHTVSAAGGADLEGNSGAGTDLLTAANGLLAGRPPAAAATAAATAAGAVAPSAAAGAPKVAEGMPSMSGGGAPTSCSTSYRASSITTPSIALLANGLCRQGSEVTVERSGGGRTGRR